MQRLTAQSTSTWAEDTALLRSTRSAAPGAETEARAVPRSPGFLRFGISTSAPNLRGTTPRHPDRTSPPLLANADQPEFQFPLNQDIEASDKSVAILTLTSKRGIFFVRPLHVRRSGPTLAEQAMNHKKPSTMTLLFASLMLAVMQIGCESRSRPEATESAFDRVLDAKTLRVAYISYPPSFIKDANTGEFSGIFHEVLADIAKRLDLKVEYVEETAWGTMIETVKSGRADIVCTGIWPNSTRAKFVDFTDAIYFSPIKAYVRKGNSAFDGNRSAIDSPEVTIATIDGEMTSIIASSDFPKAKTQSHPQTTDIAQMLLEVASGKAAITFVEPAVAAEFAKANPDAIQEVEGIPPLRVFPNVMMVAKGEARLLSTLNIALAEASSIGVIDRVVSKYESNPGLFFRRSSPYREVQP